MSKHIKKPIGFYKKEHCKFSKAILQQISRIRQIDYKDDQSKVFNFICKTKLSFKCQLFLLHIMFSDLKFGDIADKYKIKTNYFRVSLHIIYNYFNVSSVTGLIKTVFKLRKRIYLEDSLPN